MEGVTLVETKALRALINGVQGIGACTEQNYLKTKALRRGR